MKSKIVIVTGATSGIGKEIARGLAKKGATVILGVRNEEKARGVRNEIAKDVGNEHVSVMLLDVARQSSIRDFAKAFRAKHDRLDVLVNNAGAWFSDRRESPDGIELEKATSKFYDAMKEKESKFRDGLDELAHICERMTSKTEVA